MHNELFMKQRASGGAQQPRDNRRVLVTTTLGTSVFHPNARVLVPVGGEFFGKHASDVQEGDSVLFVKQALRGGGTRITLDDVDAVLRQSGRYTHALRELFAQCPDGAITTVFKRELLGGIALPQSTLLWPEGVRREDVKLLVTQGNVNQIEERPLEEAAYFVHETLSAQQATNGNPVVSVEHVLRGWLGGTTLAPREYAKVFAALGGIAPGLLQLASSPAFAESYKLYVAIRQGVMRAIWDVLGEGRKRDGDGSGSERGENGASFTIRPEIRLVVNHFIADVHELYASARVVKVEQRKSKGEEHAEGVLTRGVATEGSEGIKMKSMRELDLELCVLEGLVRRLVHGYLKRTYYFGFKKISRDALAMDAGAFLGEMLGFKSTVGVSREFFEKMERAGVLLKYGGASPPEHEQAAREIAAEIVRALDDGTIDKMYSLPKGLARRVFDAHYERNTAVPKIVYYRKSLEHVKAIEGIDVKKLNAEIRRVEEQIERTYERYARWTDFMQIVAIALVDRNPEWIDKIYESSEPVLEMLARFTGNDTKEVLAKYRENTITDEMTRKVLRDLGFEEAEKIYRFAGIS